MSELGLYTGPSGLKWRLILLLVIVALTASYVSGWVLYKIPDTWVHFNSVFSFYTSEKPATGPPYIAYEFSLPLLSGFLFHLALSLSGLLSFHQAIVLLALPFYIAAVYSTLLLKGKGSGWTFFWFLAPSPLLLALSSWEIVSTSLVLLSAYFLHAGRWKWASFTLALACTSSLYPVLLAPLFVFKLAGRERQRFSLCLLFSFTLLNFPFFVTNSERWLRAYALEVKGLIVEGSLWHPLLGDLTRIIPVSLITLSLFALGYIYIASRAKGKSLHRLIAEVLILFLLLNGVYLADTNIWVLPFLGVSQLSFLFLYVFDLASAVVPLLSTLYTPAGLPWASLIREVAILILLLYVWIAKPIEIQLLENPFRGFFSRVAGSFNSLLRRLRATSLKFATVFLLLLALFIILPRLNEPEQIYFDEVHYVEAARSVVGGLGDPNWQHPPMAKLLISGGVWLWGDNSWGWRLPGALLGILCVPLMFLIGERMYGSRRIGLSAALLLAFDFMFFVQSRIAMLDIFVLAFSLLGLYFFLSSDRYGWSYAILSGIFFGLAVSSKISGGLVILTCLIFSASGVRRRGGRDFLRLLTALIFLPMLVYVASHIPILSLSLLSPEVFLSYQTRLLKYSATMVEAHPYMSEPWTWPLMSRPLLYLYDTVKIGDLLYVATVSALGNPLTWYVGFGVILATFPRVLRQRRWDFSFLWFLLTWLPFFPIGIAHTFFSGGRPMFIYYFLQSVPPLIFCLSRYLEDVDDVLGVPVSVLFILSALAGFIISYPVISAYPVSQEYVRGMGTLRLRL